MCYSVGKVQVTHRCHPAQCTHSAWSAVLFLHSRPCCLNTTYRLRLAGHSLSITAALHRQNKWPLAPADINQHRPHAGLITIHMHTNPSVVLISVCARSRMCLSPAINILYLILWPWCCVGALLSTSALTPGKVRSHPEETLLIYKQRLKEEASCCAEWMKEICFWALKQFNCPGKEKKKINTLDKHCDHWINWNQSFAQRHWTRQSIHVPLSM